MADQWWEAVAQAWARMLKEGAAGLLDPGDLEVDGAVTQDHQTGPRCGQRSSLGPSPTPVPAALARAV